MKNLVVYILIGLGTVALIRFETFQIESTTRDVASIYTALHPSVKTNPSLYGSFLNDVKNYKGGGR